MKPNRSIKFLINKSIFRVVNFYSYQNGPNSIFLMRKKSILTSFFLCEPFQWKVFIFLRFKFTHRISCFDATAGQHPIQRHSPVNKPRLIRLSTSWYIYWSALESSWNELYYYFHDCLATAKKPYRRYYFLAATKSS